jgi:hypothetical protein
MAPKESIHGKYIGLAGLGIKGLIWAVRPAYPKPFKNALPSWLDKHP